MRFNSVVLACLALTSFVIDAIPISKSLGGESGKHKYGQLEARVPPKKSTKPPFRPPGASTGGPASGVSGSAQSPSIAGLSTGQQPSTGQQLSSGQQPSTGQQLSTGQQPSTNPPPSAAGPSRKQFDGVNLGSKEFHIGLYTLRSMSYPSAPDLKLRTSAVDIMAQYSAQGILGAYIAIPGEINLQKLSSAGKHEVQG